jgi:UDP-glucose 4-epimerase
MRILVAGGAGYIGSHTCVALAMRGHSPVIFDNLCNASAESPGRVSELVGSEVPFVCGDVRDANALDALFARERFDAVVHFAALKAVGESVRTPLAYFENNVGGTIVLLQAMQRAEVRRLVFSSSATVYGDAKTIPVREDAPLSATNPYGRTKLVAEQLIGDVCNADAAFEAISLRYFNPIGAHSSGRIGEDPNGTPNNLMPFITQVAIGRLERLQVFGGDWPTPDGTGIRDYVHVMDLAEAHVAALERLERGHMPVNIGTGRGTSVLELVGAFEKSTGCAVAHEFVARRDGDVAALWADSTRAERVLGWKAQHGIDRMCEDAWRWQLQNPNGYV